jgi:hypothetical protein
MGRLYSNENCPLRAVAPMQGAWVSWASLPGAALADSLAPG